MKVTAQHNVYGQIDYEEDFWTGKKSLTINGTKLQKQNKNTFVWNQEGEALLCRIKGNFITGSKLEIGQDTVELTPAAAWYEIACSVLLVVLMLVWGNSVTLCSILPIVGGGIGGAISGLMGCTNLMLMRKSKNVGIKLLIWLGMLAATFFICFLLAMFLLVIFY